MPIEFPCPICHQQVRTPDAAAGKKGKCPHCGTLVMIPAPIVVQPPTAGPPKPALESRLQTRPPDPARMPPSRDVPAPAGSIEFDCPQCHHTVRTPAAAAGKKGQCPHCHAVVQIPFPLAELAAPAKPIAPSKPIAPKAEAKPEPPKPEPTKSEPPKPEFPRPEIPRIEVPKPEIAKPAAPKPEVAKPTAPAKPAPAKPTPDKSAPAKPTPAKPMPVAKALPTARPIPASPAPAKAATKPDPEIIDLEELPADQPGSIPGLVPLGPGPTPGLVPLGSGLTPLGSGLTPLGSGLTPLGGGLTPLGPTPAASGLVPLGPAPAVPAGPDPFAGLTPISAYPAVAPPPPNPLGMPAGYGATNPYAAPAYGQPVYQPRVVTDSHRRGLPWEKDPSMDSFNETMTLVLGSPQEAFSHMRRTGGLGNPIGFMIIGMVIGALANAIYYGIIGNFLQAAAGEHPFNIEALVLVGVFYLVGGVVGGVIIAPIATFIMAAIHHLLLAMVGGGNAGYEATFRCLCYVTGSTAILFAIPCVGPLLYPFFAVIVLIHAFANAHETSGGKASFSVLGPYLGVTVCGCGCGMMLILPAVMSAMDQLP